MSESIENEEIDEVQKKRLEKIFSSIIYKRQILERRINSII
jgi:hypothetical protein